MDYWAAMQTFVRAVELKSFSKVAVDIGCKVSTVSRNVSALEADLGVALFNRSTHGLRLTEAGETFYRQAVELLAGLEAARGETAAFNSRPRGLLRINVPSVFGRRHVMPHMKEFLHTYPDISLDATLTDATVDLIETGADVAVRIGALIDSALIAKQLAPQRRLLVAAPAYVDARPALLSPAQLGEHQCLRFALQPTGAWYYRTAGQPKAPLHEVPVDGNLRANDSETLRDSALAGLGVCLLPTWLIQDDLRAGLLVTMLPQWEWTIAPGPERAIWAIYPPKKFVSTKVRCFIAFLEHRFGRPPYWDAS